MSNIIDTRGKCQEEGKLRPQDFPTIAAYREAVRIIAANKARRKLRMRRDGLS